MQPICVRTRSQHNLVYVLEKIETYLRLNSDKPVATDTITFAIRDWILDDGLIASAGVIVMKMYLGTYFPDDNWQDVLVRRYILVSELRASKM